MRIFRRNDKHIRRRSKHALYERAVVRVRNIGRDVAGIPYKAEVKPSPIQAPRTLERKYALLE